MGQVSRAEIALALEEYPAGKERPRLVEGSQQLSDWGSEGPLWARLAYFQEQLDSVPVALVCLCLVVASLAS